jgi:hypothetical protein
MPRGALVTAVLLTLTLGAGCSDPPEPISVDDNAITVINSTSHDWSNLLIVVNDHYRGGAPLLRADGRLNAPVSGFDTGFGQRWPVGTTIRKVQVTADGANGEPVKLDWEIGQQKKRP